MHSHDFYAQVFAYMCVIFVFTLFYIISKWEFSYNYSNKVISSIGSPFIVTSNNKYGNVYSIRATVDIFDCYIELYQSSVTSKAFINEYNSTDEFYYVWQSGLYGNRCYHEKIPK